MGTGANNPENEELDENGQPRRKKGFSLNPLDLFSNFSFSSLLTLAVIFIGGYFLARTEGGREFLNNLVGNLSPEWQAKIGGFLEMIGIDGVASSAMYDYAESMTAEQAREQMDGKVPAEVANILAADDATWKRVVGHLRESGANMLDPISERSIFQLMTREPQMVQQILRAIPRDGGNTEGREKIMGAVRNMVGNPQMFATLLSTEHRANTFAALEAISPIPFQSGRLQRFIETTGLKDGQPTAQLTGLMNAMLGNDPAAMTQAGVDFLKASSAKDIHQLFQGVNPNTVPEGMLRDIVTAAKHEGNLQALMTLTITLGQEKMVQLSTALNSGDASSALGTIQADPAMLNALTTFARTSEIDQLPAAWRGPVELLRAGPQAVKTASALGVETIQQWQQNITGGNPNLPADQMASNFVLTALNPDMRASLTQNGGLTQIGRFAKAQAEQTAGDERRMYGFLGTLATTNSGRHYVNIDRINWLTEQLSNNPDNFGTPERGAATTNVVDGLVRFVVSGNADALKNVTPEAFAQFFSSRTNINAFHRFLNGIDTRALAPAHQNLITALKKHWGGPSDGIAEVLGDTETARMFLDMLKNPTAMQQAMQAANSSGILADAGKAIWWSSLNPWGATDKMSENRDHLEAVAAALKQAGVGAAPAQAGHGAPAGAGQRQRH